MVGQKSLCHILVMGDFGFTRDFVSRSWPDPLFKIKVPNQDIDKVVVMGRNGEQENRAEHRGGCCEIANMGSNLEVSGPAGGKVQCKNRGLNSERPLLLARKFA